MSSPATSLELLVIADPHFAGAASPACVHPRRQARLGQILLRKVLWRLKHLGEKPDLIVLLGDLVDDGNQPGAREDWLALAGEALRSGIPVLGVPGNHDGDAGRSLGMLLGEPGMHVVGGCVFLLFHDERVQGELFRRPEEQLRLPALAAAAHPGKPIIALQHHPHDPVIASEYPYHLANREAVMASYREAGVCLSLSGHYHAGQPAHAVDGVTYATAPALCEAPYRFQQIRIQGRGVEVREHALRLEAPGLVDNHCHTELAYCSTTVSITDAIRLSQALGVETLCFTEHTFQLYFERDIAWSFLWQTDPAVRERVWATPERGRMGAYRRLARVARSPSVRAGLEVDLCADGSLLLAPEDAGGWDLLVGAVHEIPGFRKGVSTQAEAEELFLRDVRRLLSHPIDVLAHPFRFFPRKGLQKPVHLYPVVADLLAASGVAAEINFHTNQPEVEFFQICLERGVRLSLGSDSHELAEIGEMAPHLDVLARAGARGRPLAQLLVRPRGAAAGDPGDARQRSVTA
jgi:histidinol phosphatase-like PHP family hydrolase/predicted phosphodiesterase